MNSDTSRKIKKNPLLSAAGFGFENFAENAVLMPVTPANPVVLQDEGEIDSFVGQEPSVSVSEQFSNPETSGVQHLSSEIIFPSAGELQDPTPQPQKQGYFSSILSSLPNLSLSSITGENSPNSSQNQNQNQNPKPQNSSSVYGSVGESNPYTYATDNFSYGVPPVATTSVAPNFYNPSTASIPGVTEISSVPPPQPPAVLPPTGGSASYRLGAQRRLKYAPPPDLTSNAPKQYPAPNLQPFPQQNLSSPATFYNPNSQAHSFAGQASFSPSAPPISGNPSPAHGSSQQGSIRASPVQVGLINATHVQNKPFLTSENVPQVTQNKSVQGPTTSFNPSGSYHLNPVTSSLGFVSSQPQTIPPKLSESHLEPFTPQNTPANAASSGFSSFPAQNWTPANLGADLQVVTDRKPLNNIPGANVVTPGDRNVSSGTFFEQQSFSAPQRSVGTTFEVLQPVNVPPAVPADNIIEPDSNPPEPVVENIQGLAQTLPTFTPSLFTPISAAKVSEKLEHLLAEQKEVFASERSSDPPAETSGTAPEVQSVNLATSERSEEKGQFTNDRVEGEGDNTPNAPTVKSDTLAEIDLTRSESFSDLSDRTVVKEGAFISSVPPSLTGKSFNQSALNFPPHYSEAVRTFVSGDSLADSFSHNDRDKPLEIPHGVEPTGSIAQNQSEQKKASNYFAPAEGLSAPSFYNPAEYQREAPVPYPAPVAPVPLTTGSYTGPNPSCPSDTTYPGVPNPFASDPGNRYPVHAAPTDTVPTFYDPSQFQANPGPYFADRKQTPLNSYFQPPGINQSSFLNPSPFGRDNNAQSGFFPTPSNPEAPGYFTPPTPPMATVVPEATGSATLNPVQMSGNHLGGHATPDTVPPSLQSLAAGPSDRQMQYRPVYQHWFHRKEVETKVLWLPFSMQDSLNLEEAHNSTEITPETTVATDGGRYDVVILRRRRTPVYWSGSPSEVRRCSWFYKGPAESRYVPYEESIAARLEEEYKQACLADNWNRKIELNNGEHIIFHSATVQVHYLQAGTPDLAASWGNSAGSEDSTYLQGAATRPRVVKRGVDEFNIDEGEPDKVDHLLFLVHGIGSVCDLKFRSVEEVVDEFRSISLQLVQSHYRTASERSIVNRIEVLPISWHTTLHSEDTGIDKKLQAITLESIPKLRHFTNDTLLDILFYTSPIYCQTIMQTVGNEMNKLYSLFRERNPSFEGGVYLGGHSLGSLIVFDLLCHQKPPKEEVPDEREQKESSAEPGEEDTVSPMKPSKPAVLKRRLSRKISYVMGSAGTGQPYINYPQLNFHPNAFFALGSPIGMFVTVRGIDTLGEDFALPTCPSFFNIFHPFDPVAYRVEALIDPEAHKHRPMLIPHHKGRKRMHLELKETMARVGADIKQKLLDSVRSTWNSVYQLAVFHRQDNQALEREIDKVVEEQLQHAPSEPEQQNDESGADIKIGKLNGGRRVDYVLQEAPFEYINEYIFALTSHVCYWESEDTMLMILKEIYGSAGIQTDAQLPQQTMTIERATPSPVMARANLAFPSGNPINQPEAGELPGGSGMSVLGMDPTAPISEKPIGPPPTAGFVRKT